MNPRPALFAALLLAAAAPEPSGFRMDHYRGDVPATLHGARVVSTAQLAALIAQDHPVLIDVLPAPAPPPDPRPEMKRMPLPHRNIPGSLWLPDIGRGAISPALAASFRATLARAGASGAPVVFYCLSHCWMSWNAAKRAVQYGDTNVVWYPDGADGWAQAGHPTAPATPAAPRIIAVADFSYVDSSGEPKDQTAAHARRIAKLQTDIIGALTHDGDTAVKLACATPPCSADNLEESDIAAAAKKQGATAVVFGDVHKISTLIEFGHVGIMDVATRKALLSREVQFRGDTDDAWTHAADYLAGMVSDTLKQQPAP